MRLSLIHILIPFGFDVRLSALERVAEPFNDFIRSLLVPPLVDPVVKVAADDAVRAAKYLQSARIRGPNPEVCIDEINAKGGFVE